MKMLNFVYFVIAICFTTACRPFVTTSLEADLFEKTLGQTPDPQLIDVRTPKEFTEGYLPGASLMDIKDANFDSQILALDKNRPVFVYCRSGKRSLEAANILEKYKFKLVYNLEGGIIAWKDKGKAVVMP
ncbi:MAG: rhodanese-like domain-containing protein [Bacteroidales bacterium]|jgi:rhodanese-related sulfurtransferase|nr:rhodanese-like domain-containing protein [Bacteroidales bacterium]